MREKRKKPKREWKIGVNLNETEYTQIHEEQKKTTCRSLSEFARNKLLGVPITVFYRNASADDFLPIALSLKEELHDIGDNLNLVIKEIRAVGHLGNNPALLDNLEAGILSVGIKTEEIRFRMHQIYQQWSHE